MDMAYHTKVKKTKKKKKKQTARSARKKGLMRY